MTADEYAAKARAALAYLKRTQIAYPEWARRKTFPGYNYQATNWQHGIDELEAIIAAAAPPPPPSPPPATENLLRGRGVFTAWDAGAALGLRLDWLALQADPEGRPLHADNFPGVRALAWQARPDGTAMQHVHDLGCTGYIAQAESPPELEAALAVGPAITVPKYLVGKPDGWGATPTEIGKAQARAVAGGWGLLIEWYWNDQNELTRGPDSRGYPVSACLFGCFQGRGERKYLSDYRQVWAGSFGAYTAETLVDFERLALM